MASGTNNDPMAGGAKLPEEVVQKESVIIELVSKMEENYEKIMIENKELKKKIDELTSELTHEKNISSFFEKRYETILAEKRDSEEKAKKQLEHLEEQVELKYRKMLKLITEDNAAPSTASPAAKRPRK